MNRRRALATFAGLAVLPLLAACPGGSQTSAEEDCDADDLIEGDEDCDTDSTKRKKKKTKKPRKPKRS